MAQYSLSQKSHERLARLRRRVWLVIAICLVGQIGNAALHANAPDTKDIAESSKSETCPATAPGIQNYQSDTINSGNNL